VVWQHSTSRVIEKKTRSVGSLAPGSACINWNVACYSCNIASDLICLDVKCKCSNSSNNRRLESVSVPLIQCYVIGFRVNILRITETAKRSNVVNTWIAFCPEAKPGHFGVPKTTFGILGQSIPNRDCPGKTGTVGQLGHACSWGQCRHDPQIFSVKGAWL